MNIQANKKSGFNRLRTITNITMAAGAAVIAAPAMSARAAPVNTDVTIISIPGSINTAYWTEIGTTSPLQIEDGSLCFSTSTCRGDALDGALWMSVDGNDFEEPLASADYSNNPTLTSAVAVDIIPGVDATIQYHFYKHRALVRALYTLTNTTDTDIITNAVIGGELGSDEDTTIEATSSGNTSIEDIDYWTISSEDGESSSADPILTITRYGEGAQVIPSTQETIGAGDEYFEYVYNITIPANSTVHLVSFIEMNLTIAAAQASATDFNSSVALENAGLIDDAASVLKGPVLNYGINGDNAPSTPSSLDKIDAATNSTGAAGITLPGLGILAGLLIARRRRQK